MVSYAPTTARYVTYDDDDDDVVILQLPPADPEAFVDASLHVATACHIWDNITPPDGLDSEAVITRMRAKCDENSLTLCPLFTQMCSVSICNICCCVYDDGCHYPMAMDPCNHVMCYSCCKCIMGQAVDPCPVCRTMPTNIVKVQSTATVMRALLEEEEKNLKAQVKKKETNPSIADMFKNFLLNRLELARCQQMGFLETACDAAKEELNLRAEVRSILVKKEFDRLSEEIATSFDQLSGMDNATLLPEAQNILKRVSAKAFFHKTVPDTLPNSNQATAIMNRMVQGSLLDDASAIATREKYMGWELPEGCEVFNLQHFSPASASSFSELPEGVVHRIVRNIITLNRTVSSRKAKRNTRRPARPRPASSH